MTVEERGVWHAVERARVREHLFRAEQFARRSTPPGLGQAAQRARARLLDELARYRLRGQFPKNRDFVSQTPYFIDADGTRCAVAHLLEVSGEEKLVRKIARRRNNARVAELSQEPCLLAWLGAVGLTLDEAAAIQPSYACIPATECFCESLPPNVVEAVAIGDAISGTVVATVTRVHRGEVQHPGDLIDVRSDTAVSGAALVAQSWSNTDVSSLYSEVPLYDERRPVGCGFQMTKDEYLAVAAAGDCSAALSRVDPVAARNDCEDEGCSCAIPGGGGGSAATWLGVFMALVSAAALRRSVKRST